MMFQFDKYKLRAATAEDRERIQNWMADDPAHRGQSAAFYYEAQPGVECMVLEDEQGPVFYFRIMRALRLNIQFAPMPIDLHQALRQRERTMQAMAATMEWIKEQAPRAGIRQLIFDSVSAPLIRFCEKRLGFRRSRDELVRGLDASHVTKPRE